MTDSAQMVPFPSTTAGFSYVIHPSFGYLLGESIVGPDEVDSEGMYGFPFTRLCRKPRLENRGGMHSGCPSTRPPEPMGGVPKPWRPAFAAEKVASAE